MKFSALRAAAFCAALMALSPVIPTPAARAGSPGADRGLDAAELRLELRRLSVLGSALYIAAHPDDENTNLLAHLSKGRLVRTAYLSVTRGEGGQNLIGREQGAALGVIRTEELLAARQIDGAGQYFTRAIDFGYSKRPEEAIALWGEAEIVADIVRVIRSFRPDVIITRFSPALGGHGQHTASAILARRAFDLAGDPDYALPGGGPPPWRPARLLFNGSTFMSPTYDTASALKVNTGGYNPLLGESYNEISGRSRSMHKSQGFGAAQNRGDVTNYFHHTAGDSAAADLFEGIDLGWTRVEGGARVAAILDSALRGYDPDRPADIVPFLLRARAAIGRISDDHWRRIKTEEVERLILAAAGLRAEAVASAESAAAGDSIRIRASVINRSAVPVTLRRVRLSFAAVDTAPALRLADNRTLAIDFAIVVPPGEPLTGPYWLAAPPSGSRYEIADPSLIGLPRAPTPYRAEFTLGVSGTEMILDLPVLFRTVDPVEGELYHPFVVSPPVSVIPVERVLLFPSAEPKTLTVRLAGARPGVRGTVRVETPPGWTVDPPARGFTADGGAADLRVTFALSPSDAAADGEFTVVAATGGQEIRTSTTVIRHPHIPAQTLFPPATGKLVRTDLVRKKFFVGYIEGSGDEVPDALRQIGYDVRLLTDDDLIGADLAPFQAIVAGVRAYNTRPALAAAHRRLMDYVRGGGTYVVQYATNGRLETADPGPRPFRISRERVADETAPVRLLAPEHPGLSFPNAITGEDFLGWVQERGLYFAGEWDSAYVPLVSSNDPGEPPRDGGLLVARHGDGYYCYTGLSFFRQLPAGVPGAYRLFTNLVELGSRERLRGKR